MREKAGRKYFVLVSAVYCCVSCCHCINVEQDVASFIVPLKCFTPGQLHSLFVCRRVLMLKGANLKLYKLNIVWFVLFPNSWYLLCHDVGSGELMGVAVLVASL